MKSTVCFLTITCLGLWISTVEGIRFLRSEDTTEFEGRNHYDTRRELSSTDFTASMIQVSNVGSRRDLSVYFGKLGAACFRIYDSFGVTFDRDMIAWKFVETNCKNQCENLKISTTEIKQVCGHKCFFLQAHDGRRVYAKSNETCIRGVGLTAGAAAENQIWIPYPVQRIDGEERWAIYNEANHRRLFSQGIPYNSSNFMETQLGFGASTDFQPVRVDQLWYLRWIPYF